MSMTGDTIAAVATAPGRGGVSVVRVSGPDAYAVATRVTGRLVDASWAGRFFHARFGTFDDGLVLVFREPSSYTGEDVVELQGHGGSVAPRRLLEACLAAGARLARRGEFTERAFLNGRLDLGMAEAVIDLVDARTERAADDAAARLAGEASRAFEGLYARVVDVSSRVEHALDFDEGELPTDFSAQVARDVLDLLLCVDRKLSTAREGRILREGALVVLAGAPNAGKSSLLNALVGERRAIVSLTAGTTRDAIEEWLEIGGWPVRLVDTAGLRATADAVEAEGVARAEELVARADVVLWLTAADGDGEAVERTKAEGEVIPIVSKCDLDSVGKAAGLRISVKTGEGLEELRGEIARCLTARAAKSAEEAGADITTRQTACLREARQALMRARTVLGKSDWVVAANELRVAAESIGRILGKVYSDDLLEALFSRFCIGK